MASLASSHGLCIIPLSLETNKKVILSFKDSLTFQIRSNKTRFEREVL